MSDWKRIMEPDTVRHVLVVGGGSAGFMTALAFKHKMPWMEVTLVHSTKIPIIGVGESTTIAFPRFIHDFLDIPYAEFFEAAKPSWKLGIRFEWGDPQRGYFNYTFDASMAGARPHLERPVGSYCLENPNDASLLCAAMNQKRSPCFLLNGRPKMASNYGYHIDANLMVQYLETACVARGVNVIDAEITSVKPGPKGVECIGVDDGRQLSADLFVDCTGFRSLLLSQTLGVPKKSYEDILLCDRAWAGRYERPEGEVLPYTTTSTLDHGWSWQIEFQDHVTRGYVFSSQFCDDDEAAQELVKACPELGGTDALRLLKFPRNRYESYWMGNVAAIGNASGFVEPLEATALHMATEQIRGLVLSLSENEGRVLPSLQKLQNQRYRNLWDDVCAFLAIHYRFNRFRQTPFWQHCQQNTELTIAGDFVEAYQECGPSYWLEKLISDSIFGLGGYLAMMIGQNVECQFPYHPDEREVQVWESHKRSLIADAQKALPIRKALEKIEEGSWDWKEATRARPQR